MPQKTLSTKNAMSVFDSNIKEKKNIKSI